MIRILFYIPAVFAVAPFTRASHERRIFRAAMKGRVCGSYPITHSDTRSSTRFKNQGIPLNTCCSEPRESLPWGTSMSYDAHTGGEIHALRCWGFPCSRQDDNRRGWADWESGYLKVNLNSLSEPYPTNDTGQGAKRTLKKLEARSELTPGTVNGALYPVLG